MTTETKKNDGGKGDTPRPLSVSIEQFDKNFDAIFGKKPKEKVSRSGILDKKVTKLSEKLPNGQVCKEK